MAGGRSPITREGYEKKKAELYRLQNHDMIEIARRIATARELGDLSENAEYHAAREDQGMLQARIDSLKDDLACSEIIDPSTLSTETVVFGCKVKVIDLIKNEELTFTLVGPGDDDPENKRILITSPRGKGLLGKRRGDIAEIVVPARTLKYRIVDIYPGS